MVSCDRERTALQAVTNNEAATKPIIIDNHCIHVEKLMKKCEECARRTFSKGSPSHCHHEHFCTKGLKKLLARSAREMKYIKIQEETMNLC